MNVEELGENLKKCTFNALDYFEKLPEGAYVVTDKVFTDILQHPALRPSAFVRIALQNGEDIPKSWTSVFNSISKFHLEFNNNVIIVHSIFT